MATWRIYSGNSARRWVGLVLCLALLSSACGGSGGGVVETASGVTSASTNLPADLDFLGSMASGTGGVATQIFDATGGVQVLDDGTTITVPAGALSALTAIESITVVLDLDDPLAGTVYRLSTVEDVSLGEPVILEIPKQAGSVMVAQRVDGEWSSVVVPEGPTTKVAIPHFSEVTTSVIDRPDQATISLKELPSDGILPSVFLDSCVLMFVGEGDDDYLNNLALSVCTQALVEALTPPGESKVSVECVGDKIGGDVDIRAAISKCVADSADNSSNPEAAADADGTVGTSDAEPTAAADGDDGELCGGTFAPPYLNTIEPQPVMDEVQILGPLETKYYYTTVEGTLEVLEDGSFELMSRTVRFGDITIRGEPDNQVYEREVTATGVIDLVTGEGAIEGNVTGSDTLWSDDPQPGVIDQAVVGRIVVRCDEIAPSGFVISGTVDGQGYLAFEVRP